jgi:purine-binding chemotaxis protein CheW
MLLEFGRNARFKEANDRSRSMMGSTETINHYVVFQLGEEVYALDVVNAREIVGVSTLTPIPSVPEWIRGVVNLRGAVVPVIDMKTKFSMGRTEPTANSCVLVVEFAADGEDFVVGVLADRVLEVLELSEAAIEPLPKFGARFSRAYLRGLGRKGDLLFVILDAAKVFSDVNVDLTGPLGELPAGGGENATVAAGGRSETGADTGGGGRDVLAQ